MFGLMQDRPLLISSLIEHAATFHPRTEIVSRMCADAPVHHATAYEDLERVSRGQYRRRSPAAPQPGTEAAGDNPPHSAPG